MKTEFNSVASTRRLPRRLPRLVLLASLLAAGAANAGLVGDSVGARLVDFVGGVVAPQFAPTAIVGAGVEFNGTWSYAPLGQIWNVALDMDASTFTISFNDVGLNSSSDLCCATFFGLQLSDLDFGSNIIGMTELASDGAAVQSIGFTPRGVTVQWNVFQFRDASGNPLAGGSSTFAIQTAVPEPATGALAALGLLAMALLRKRNRTAGQR